MHRPGAKPENMQISDFLCDFCARQWDGTFPLVEGHQGSLICGRCLTVAYTDAALAGHGAEPGSYTCTLCLEERDQIGWQSPVRPEATACLRCIKQSATRLDKDKDWQWSKPADAGDADPG